MSTSSVSNAIARDGGIAADTSYLACKENYSGYLAMKEHLRRQNAIIRADQNIPNSRKQQMFRQLQKAVSQVCKHPHPIRSKEDAKTMEGIGDKYAEIIYTAIKLRPYDENDPEMNRQINNLNNCSNGASGHNRSDRSNSIGSDSSATRAISTISDDSSSTIANKRKRNNNINSSHSSTSESNSSLAYAPQEGKAPWAVLLSLYIQGLHSDSGEATSGRESIIRRGAATLKELDDANRGRLNEDLEVNSYERENFMRENWNSAIKVLKDKLLLVGVDNSNNKNRIQYFTLTSAGKDIANKLYDAFMIKLKGSDRNNLQFIQAIGRHRLPPNNYLEEPSVTKRSDFKDSEVIHLDDGDDENYVHSDVDMDVCSDELNEDAVAGAIGFERKSDRSSTQTKSDRNEISFATENARSVNEILSRIKALDEAFISKSKVDIENSSIISNSNSNSNCNNNFGRQKSITIDLTNSPPPVVNPTMRVSQAELESPSLSTSHELTDLSHSSSLLSSLGASTFDPSNNRFRDKNIKSSNFIGENNSNRSLDLSIVSQSETIDSHKSINKALPIKSMDLFAENFRTLKERLEKVDQNLLFDANKIAKSGSHADTLATDEPWAQNSYCSSQRSNIDLIDLTGDDADETEINFADSDSYPGSNKDRGIKSFSFSQNSINDESLKSTKKTIINPNGRANIDVLKSNDTNRYIDDDEDDNDVEVIETSSRDFPSYEGYSSDNSNSSFSRTHSINSIADAYLGGGEGSNISRKSSISSNSSYSSISSMVSNKGVNSNTNNANVSKYNYSTIVDLDNSTEEPSLSQSSTYSSIAGDGSTKPSLFSSVIRETLNSINAGRRPGGIGPISSFSLSQPSVSSAAPNYSSFDFTRDNCSLSQPFSREATTGSNKNKPATSSFNVEKNLFLGSSINRLPINDTTMSRTAGKDLKALSRISSLSSTKSLSATSQDDGAIVTSNRANSSNKSASNLSSTNKGSKSGKTGGSSKEDFQKLDVIVTNPHDYEVVLIVDNREKQKEFVSATMNDKNGENINMKLCSLPLGDFLWIAVPKAIFEDGAFLKQEEKLSKNGPSAKSIIVLDYIIERKTMSDLSSSMIDDRYRNQQNRMKKKSNITNCMYFLEGLQMSGDSHSSISNNGLRKAMLDTQIGNGFKIVRTRSIDHTINMLKNMNKMIIHDFYDQSKYPKSIQSYAKFYYNTKPISGLCYPDANANLLFQHILYQVSHVSPNVINQLLNHFQTFNEFLKYFRNNDKNTVVSWLAGLRKIGTSNQRFGPQLAQDLWGIFGDIY